MKKTYSKPDIFFEDFSLSTSIAAGCEEKPSVYAADVRPCGVKWDAGIYVFTETMYGCNIKAVSGKTENNLVDSQNNALCYHNPSENYNVFYS